MTIVTTSIESGPYIAVAQTTFAVTFQAISASEIEIYKDGVLVTPASYAFTRDADGTGEVVFTTPVTGSIVIRSNPNFLQGVSFNKFGAFYPDSINASLDAAALRDLRLLYDIGEVDDRVDDAFTAIYEGSLGGPIGSNTLLGNNTGVTALPVALSTSIVAGMLPIFTTLTNGLAPLSPGGSTSFLAADGVWRIPATNVGSVAWGSITGTLSGQTDLQTALNAKANQTDVQASLLTKANLAGATFTGAISATNLSGTNTGDQTSATVTHADTVGAPAYLKTVSDIVNGLPINMFRFVSPAKIAGIRVRSDTSDLSADFATAVASGAKEIVIEPGLYNTISTITMATEGQHLRGAGSNRSEIKINSTTANAIQLNNGVAGYGVSGLKITRTGVPGAAAGGVVFLGTTDKSFLEDLVLEDHYNLSLIHI